MTNKVRPVPRRKRENEALVQRRLELVRTTARMLERAIVSRDNDILRAHRDGASLRELGEAAGLNHETVRKIVKGGER